MIMIICRDHGRAFVLLENAQSGITQLGDEIWVIGAAEDILLRFQDRCHACYHGLSIVDNRGHL